MTASLDALKGKIQRILTDNFGPIEIDGDGDFTIRYNSARIFINCRDWADGKSLVGVFSMVLADIPKSDALNEYVAYHSDDYVFGHLGLNDQGDACSLVISHNLLGDYLDEEELLHAVAAVARTADELDDELQKQFGGTRFHEDA